MGATKLPQAVPGYAAPPGLRCLSGPNVSITGRDRRALDESAYHHYM